MSSAGEAQPRAVLAPRRPAAGVERRPARRSSSRRRRRPSCRPGRRSRSTSSARSSSRSARSEHDRGRRRRSTRSPPRSSAARFAAAADEMNATLIRSAYTPVIYEMKDCSVALLDAEHRVLGQSAGLPIFLGNLEICTRIDRGDVRPRGLAAGRRLDHERLLPDRYAPQRHDGVRADLPRRRARRLRRLPRPLARRRREGPGRADGLDLDLPGGHPARPDARSSRAACSAATSPTCSAATAASPTPRSATSAPRSPARAPASARLAAIIAPLRAWRRSTAARDEIFAQTERFERAAVAAIPDGVYRAEGCLDNDGITDEPSGCG